MQKPVTFESPPPDLHPQKAHAMHPASPYAHAFRRRGFLQGTVSLAAAAAWAARADETVLSRPTFSADPFSLGVASGDPTADGFVIWTRLAPDPLHGGGMPSEPVEVRWEVSEDEAFTRVVRRGTTVATPDWAHSVHVEPEGLDALRVYWYRFHAGDATSPVGRARTVPAAGEMPAALRFAFASCQHFEQGFYTAYAGMVADDPAVIIHLGDYIYEGASKADAVRSHIGGKLDSLGSYRDRHALYKSDRLLQAAHAHCPWIVTWDDHEFENNYADDIPAKSELARVDFLARRAAAYQAYYEHMPLRRASLPQGPLMQLYRRVSYGSLAEFFVLDTRQHRSDQPCGDGVKAPCEAVMDPAATLTGSGQERWLLDGFRASKARFNVLAQQVMMARVDRAPGDEFTCSMDQWAGYEVQRRRVIRALAERPEANGIVLTGDIHSHWANDLLVEDGEGPPQVAAVEFVGTSISSGGNGKAEPANRAVITGENPAVKFYSGQRGYVTCDLGPERCETTYRVVDVVDRPGGKVTTAARFVVENGRPGLLPG
jgi:alkaline phosphatase D